MAQTTGAISVADAQIEVSTDGATWYDVSGSTNSIGSTEQSGQIHRENTLDGQDPIIKAGNKDPLALQVRVIYTETAGEAWERVRAQWETSGRELYFRYSPGGGDSGDKLYTSANSDGSTTAGVLSAFQYPEVPADGGIGMGGFTVEVPALAQSTIS